MFKVEIVNNGAEQKLVALAARAGEIPPEVWKEVASVMVEERKKDFEVGGRPAWIPSITAQAEGRKTLVKSGKMRDTAEISEISDNGVEVAFGRGLGIYPFVQQFGATIRAKNKPYLKFKINGQWIQKKEVVILARRHVRFNDEMVKRIYSLLKNYILHGKGSIEING